MQGWKLFSVFGTKEDFDYAKTNLEKEYSEVEIYIPRRHLLQGLGCINHSDESPEFNKYRPNKKVAQKNGMLWHSTQRRSNIQSCCLRIQNQV